MQMKMNLSLKIKVCSAGRGSPSAHVAQGYLPCLLELMKIQTEESAWRRVNRRPLPSRALEGRMTWLCVKGCCSRRPLLSAATHTVMGGRLPSVCEIINHSKTYNELKICEVLKPLWNICSRIYLQHVQAYILVLQETGLGKQFSITC